MTSEEAAARLNSLTFTDRFIAGSVYQGGQSVREPLQHMA